MSENNFCSAFSIAVRWKTCLPWSHRPACIGLYIIDQGNGKIIGNIGQAEHATYVEIIGHANAIQREVFVCDCVLVTDFNNIDWDNTYDWIRILI